MTQAGKKSSIREIILFTMLGLGLRGLALTLMRTAKKDPWLERALKELNGAYRFESKDRSLARHLVINKGKARMVKNLEREPDFTFTLYDPSGFSLRTREENIIDVVIENKIGQSGNMYHLYQFGFIMSLLERGLRRKRPKAETQASKNI
jgi:hypothetical protein